MVTPGAGILPTCSRVFWRLRSHHQMSHNQKKFIEDPSKVDYFYMEQFVYLLEKMDGIQEGNGKTLLDNTVLPMARDWVMAQLTSTAPCPS